MVAVQNAQGLVSAGTSAAGDAEQSRYVIPSIQPPMPVGYLPPAKNPVAIPPIRTANLGHTGRGGVGARNAPFGMQKFVDGKSYEPVAGIDRLKSHDRADVRAFLGQQMLHWHDEVAEQAPHLDAQQTQLVVEEIRARNVTRYMRYVDSPGRRKEAFEALSAIGYFLAVAAEARRAGGGPNSAETMAAQAVFARVAAEMVARSRDGGGRPRISQASAERFLVGTGETISASTSGWQSELPEAQQLARGVTVPSPDQDMRARYTPIRHAEGNLDPLQPLTSSHAAFIEVTAEADRQRDLAEGQVRMVTATRLAARRLAEGAENLGGPLSSFVPA